MSTKKRAIVLGKNKKKALQNITTFHTRLFKKEET
jgi:hypothetical protein